VRFRWWTSATDLEPPGAQRGAPIRSPRTWTMVSLRPSRARRRRLPRTRRGRGAAMRRGHFAEFGRAWDLAGRSTRWCAALLIATTVPRRLCGFVLRSGRATSPKGQHEHVASLPWRIRRRRGPPQAWKLATRVPRAFARLLSRSRADRVPATATKPRRTVCAEDLVGHRGPSATAFNNPRWRPTHRSSQSSSDH
jgi:hypothetical protein